MFCRAPRSNRISSGRSHTRRDQDGCRAHIFQPRLIHQRRRTSPTTRRSCTVQLSRGEPSPRGGSGHASTYASTLAAIAPWCSPLRHEVVPPKKMSRSASKVSERSRAIGHPPAGQRLQAPCFARLELIDRSEHIRIGHAVVPVARAREPRELIRERQRTEVRHRTARNKPQPLELEMHSASDG